MHVRYEHSLSYELQDRDVMYLIFPFFHQKLIINCSIYVM